MSAMRTYPRLIFILAALAGACGPAATTPDAGPAPGTCEPAGTAADAGPGLVTRTIEIRRDAVPRDSEDTICIDMPAGLTEDALLVGIRTHLTEGSHHLLVSLADSVTPSGTPFACAPFRHGLSSLIFIAQQAEAGLSYPRGSGLVMTAGQAIGLELHFINYFSDASVNIVGTIELDFVPIPPTFREVHIAFTGNLSLSLPPRVETTIDFTYTPRAGAEIIALTSHTHQLGLLSTIEHVTATETTPIHVSNNWADPPLDLFCPPIVFAPGDSLHLQCNFNNTTDGFVDFGEGFGNEMCFLWAYYLDPV